MNKIYKLIWSKVKNCWVVTSEMAKGHGKNKSRVQNSLLAAFVTAALLAGGVTDVQALTQQEKEEVAQYLLDKIAHGGEIPGVDATRGATNFPDAIANRIFYYNDISSKIGEKLKNDGLTLRYFGVRPDYIEPSRDYLNRYGNANWTNVDNDGAFGAHSMALGYRAFSEAKHGVAIGRSALAGGSKRGENDYGGDGGVAIGNTAWALGDKAVSIGNDARAVHKGIAIGIQAEAGLDEDDNTTDWSTAPGFTPKQGKSIQYDSKTKLPYVTSKLEDKMGAIAIGIDAKAHGNHSTAMGVGAKAKSRYAWSFGYSSEASGVGSIAFGSRATAKGTSAIAIGSGNYDQPNGGAQAYSEDAIVIGRGAKAGNEDDTEIASNTVAIGANAKAVRAYTDKKVNDAVLLGANTQVTRERGIAVGANAYVDGASGAAFGDYAKVIADEGLAIGKKAKVAYNSTKSVAIGSGAEVQSSETAVAVGTGAVVGGNSSDAIAIGTGAKTQEGAKRSIAIGNDAVVKGYDSVAIGTNASTGLYNSVAIGNGAQATLSDGIALGSDSKTTVSSGYKGYDPYKNGFNIDAHPGAAWESTKAALSVGDVGNNITRQITSVAAGRNDTDAVNVAQLKKLRDYTDTKMNIDLGNITPKGINKVKDWAQEAIDVKSMKNDYLGIQVANSASSPNKMTYYLSPTQEFYKKMNKIDELDRRTEDLEYGWDLKLTTEKNDDAGAVLAYDVVEFGVADEKSGLTVTRETTDAETKDLQGATRPIKKYTIKFGIDSAKLVENINDGDTAVTNIAAKFGVTDGTNTKAVNLGKGKNNNVEFLGTADETTVTVGGEDDKPTVTVGLAKTFKDKVTANEGNITKLQEGWTLGVARGDDSQTDNEATVEGTSKKIGAGDKVTLKAGRGIKLKQDGANVQIGLKFIDMDPAGYPFNDAKATGGGSLAVGQNSVAGAHQATAVGFDTKSKQYGVALGAASEAGKSAVAIGNKALANGEGSIAIGTSKQKVEGYPDKGLRKVDSEDAIAIGTETAVDGSSRNATAVGAYADIANSPFSTALGNHSKVENASNATAVGNSSTVKDAAYGTALGNFSRVENAELGTALGNNAAVIGARGGVAIGAHSVANRNALMPGYNPTGEQWSNFQDYLEKTGQKDAYDQATAKLEAAKQAWAADKDNPELRAKVGRAIAEQNKIVNVWAGTQGAVSIGNEQMGFTRQLTGVAAGTQDTDAVNVAQLKALKDKVTGNEGDITTLQKGWTLEDAAGSKKVVKAEDTVKVTGDDYIKATVSDDGLTLGMNETKLNKQINDQIDNSATVKAKMNSWVLKATSDKDAEKDGKTIDNDNNAVTFDATGKGLTVTRDGSTITYGIDGKQIDISENKTVTDLKTDIKNSKTTVEAGDYVTVTQKTEDGKGTTYTVNGPKVAVAKDEKNLVVDDIKEGDKKVGYELKLNKKLTGLESVTSDEFKSGNDVTLDKTGLTIKEGPSVTTKGIDAGKKKITNVADGDVSENSTDAVNGGQLYKLQQTVAGNKVTVEAAKNSQITVTSETQSDKSTKYVVDIAKDGTIDGDKDDNLVTGETVKKYVDANKTTVTGDEDGSGVKVENIAKTGEPANYKVSLGDKIKAGDVTVDGTKGQGQITGLSNTTWDADNIVSGRAATEDQLKEVSKNAAAEAAKKQTTLVAGDYVTVSEGTNTAGGKEYTVTGPKLAVVDGEENLVVGDITEGDKKVGYNLKLNKELKGLTSVSSDTFKSGDKVTINNDGLTIKDGPSVTTKGIDAGGKTIANVADGKADTDAVNVRQLNAIASQGNQNIAILGGKVSELDGRVNRVGAGAAALAALHPLDFDPDDKWDFAAGYGNYNGANAVSIGAYYRPNEDTMFSVGGSFGGGENMVNAGVSVKLGQGNNVSTSRVVMANEIRDLKTANERMQQENKAMQQENKEMKNEIEILKQQVQQLMVTK